MSDSAHPADSTRPSVLSLNIKEIDSLFAAYIPQLRNGGIFIPTNRPYRLGEEVFMLLSLPEDPAKLPVAGRVAWITPDQAQGKKAQGIGVHFSADESGRSAKHKIEAILMARQDRDGQTHTL